MIHGKVDINRLEGDQNQVVGTQVNLHIRSKTAEEGRTTVNRSTEQDQRSAGPDCSKGKSDVQPQFLGTVATFGCQVAGWGSLYLWFCIARAVLSQGSSWLLQEVLVALFAALAGVLGSLFGQRRFSIFYGSLLITILAVLWLETQQPAGLLP